MPWLLCSSNAIFMYGKIAGDLNDDFRSPLSSIEDSCHPASLKAVADAPPPPKIPCWHNKLVPALLLHPCGQGSVMLQGPCPPPAPGPAAPPPGTSGPPCRGGAAPASVTGSTHCCRHCWLPLPLQLQRGAGPRVGSETAAERRAPRGLPAAREGGCSLSRLPPPSTSIQPPPPHQTKPAASVVGAAHTRCGAAHALAGATARPAAGVRARLPARLRPGW
jgi:hypothetical protein